MIIHNMQIYKIHHKYFSTNWTIDKYSHKIEENGQLINNLINTREIYNYEPNITICLVII